MRLVNCPVNAFAFAAECGAASSDGTRTSATGTANARTRIARRIGRGIVCGPERRSPVPLGGRLGLLAAEAPAPLAPACIGPGGGLGGGPPPLGPPAPGRPGAPRG